MGRDERRYQGRPHGRHQHHGPQQGPHGVRPTRPHVRHVRPDGPPRDQQPPMPQRGPQPGDKKEFEVYQTRGPGHSRIMGKIEYDIRTLLRIAEVPADKAFLLLACSREMYSDIENNKKPEGYNRKGRMRLVFPMTRKEFYIRGSSKSGEVVRVAEKLSKILNKAGVHHEMQWNALSSAEE